MATLLDENISVGLESRDRDEAARRAVRVLHLINGDLYAGAERVQDLLAGRLSEFGYQMEFAALKQGRFDGDRQSKETPLHEVNMRSRLDPRAAQRVARILRDGDFELLHTHTPRSALVGRFAASLARVPMIHHLHSPASAEHKQAWRNDVNARVERFSVGGAAALVAVSNSVAEHARRDRLTKRGITVVHNGVPTLGPLEPRPLPTGTWTLGVAAFYRPRKGLEVLIDALSILCSKGHAVRLRVIGAFAEADYESQIKSQVARLNLESAIDWVGFQRDVIAEVRRCDLFILPSLFGEGLPMAVLEAMSAGVPVVATRVEGVPEAVRDGVDGLLVAPGDAGSLAGAIGRITSGAVDWSRLRRVAHERQAESFSEESMARGVAGVYSQVLGQRRSR